MTPPTSRGIDHLTLDGLQAAAADEVPEPSGEQDLAVVFTTLIAASPPATAGRIPADWVPLDALFDR